MRESYLLAIENFNMKELQLFWTKIDIAWIDKDDENTRPLP